MGATNSFCCVDDTAYKKENNLEKESMLNHQADRHSSNHETIDTLDEPATNNDNLDDGLDDGLGDDMDDGLDDGMDDLDDGLNESKPSDNTTETKENEDIYINIDEVKKYILDCSNEDYLTPFNESKNNNKVNLDNELQYLFKLFVTQFLKTKMDTNIVESIAVEKQISNVSQTLTQSFVKTLSLYRQNQSIDQQFYYDSFRYCIRNPDGLKIAIDWDKMADVSAFLDEELRRKLWEGTFKDDEKFSKMSEINKLYLMIKKFTFMQEKKKYVKKGEQGDIPDEVKKGMVLYFDEPALYISKILKYDKNKLNEIFKEIYNEIISTFDNDINNTKKNKKKKN